ncbi:HDOD domain-containing protein [Neptuniibacter sp. CAU 1671]|uniref:EAL and HDOD domain-containing protein n=1 Tax=Neptuniibacter sp. CAU 1671 TaxID=3032593 RepID=UPI0023DBB706|nr:HDOD domain-containing protein [Neptuniibacter sp. CAU 1671]MDF2180436.1 HDOD domain-containing protein [Neptuniibacter sp. CAU 1671]
MDRTNTPSILMARQPIYDRNQKVVAYELLYRSEGNDEHAIFTSGSEATSEVLLNAYTSICEGGTVKQVPAFLNLNRDLLVNSRLPEVSKKLVVFEILEDIEPDAEVLAAVKRLNEDGYRLAMDDFTYNEKFDPFIELCQIVKVDVSMFSSSELKQQVQHLSRFRVTLLAEKIETVEKLTECVDLGFKLFQGHFLSRPEVVKGKKIQSSHIALLQLIQELQKPNATPEKLEKMILRDPALTFKLLRIVNSAGYHLVRKVESIAQAIVLLGLEQVKKWATLIAMTSNKEKPEELTRILLIRGRMCEVIAEHDKHPNSSGFFMAGVLSGLHAMLDVDKGEMLQQIPLGDDIKDAVSMGAGPIGAVLRNVVNYENGDWDLLPSELNGNLYDKAYRHSIEWTRETMQSMYE